MKAFKKLATLSVALLMAFGVSAFAGCGKGGNTDTSSPSAETSSTTSEEKNYTCYEFVVLNADGTKVGEGYQVNLCFVNEDGTVGSCLRPLPVENGICVYNITNITEPGVYEAHVLDAESNTVELKETVRTSANAFGEYTLTLAE
jgi:hypothetical protein